ncbi:MAG: adenylate/guanylate cyclase domain-containing protein [Rhodospirillales bacterium]|nr:adenylate/guanylate cyclase domain-containing protein [Rhodospirillales bacterium]
MTATDTKAATKRSLRLPIGLVLIGGFGGLVLAAVGLALYLGFISAAVNTETLVGSQVVSLVDELENDIEMQLIPIQRRAEWVARQVEAGELDPGDVDDWDQLARGFLAGDPRRVGMAISAFEGGARIYQARDGEVLTRTIRGGRVDSELKELAERNIASLGPSWNDPMLGDERRSVVITLLTPLLRKEKLVGAFIQGLTVSTLSQRLEKLAQKAGATPYILFGGTRVLAHPALTETGSGNRTPGPRHVEGATISPEGSPLPELSQIPDDFLSDIWSPNEFDPRIFSNLRAAAPREESMGFRAVETKNGPRMFFFREFSGFGSKPWIIGVHFSRDIADAEIDRLFRSAAAGLGVLIIAVICAILLSRMAVRPVGRLANAAAQIEAGNLAEVTPLPPTPLRELDDANTSFNRMIEGLRERDLIRDLFGRYVPETVAATLVADGGGLRPQLSSATVLFADLAGFTAMSERLDPPEIVEVLNRYFSAMVDIIEGHGGVVTQFQGDAILAIYNVPIADPDHAEKAVRTAIEMQKAVSERTFAGQRLSCRIGINTGDVVAGSVGASGRLSYTVHGDSVNLAARLEQLNKHYETQTLISGTTASLIEDVDLRAMGEVEIRGKGEPVTLFAVKA